MTPNILCRVQNLTLTRQKHKLIRIISKPLLILLKSIIRLLLFRNQLLSCWKQYFPQFVHSSKSLIDFSNWINSPVPLATKESSHHDTFSENIITIKSFWQHRFSCLSLTILPYSPFLLEGNLNCYRTDACRSLLVSQYSYIHMQ